MIKSFKKAIALVVVAVFILSLVPVVGMAEALPQPTVTFPSYPTAATAMPWTGENAPSSNMMAYKADGSATGINASQYSSYWDKSTHHVEMQYSYGVFGKLPDDAVYKTRDRDTRTTADLTQPGSFYDLTVPRIDGTAFRTNDFAIEFSFAFTDINDKITALTPMYFDYAKATAGGTSGVNTGYKISVTPSSAVFVNTTKAFEKPLELNTWHNATMVFDVCADSTGTVKPSSYTYKLFIDSELYASHTINSASPMYGPRYMRLGLDNVGNSEGKTPDNWTYFDNINAFAIPSDGSASYVPTKPTASTFTSNDVNVEIIGSTITAPSDYTIADVKRALTSSKNDDVIRYYNADYSAYKGDSENALNTKVVIASLQNGAETTFANYTVEKYVKKFPDINQNASVFSKGGTGSTFYSITNETEGLGGKAADDKYIRFADAEGNPYHGVNTDNATGKQDVLEFSVYVPEGSNGVSLALGIYDSGSSYFSVPLLIREDGLYTNFSSGPNRFHTWEPNKWYHVAIETSKPYTGAVNSDGKSLDSTINNIYINGVLEHAGSFGCSRAGFRHIRFSSSLQSEDDVNAYFDNVRCYSGTYEPKWDTVAQLGYKDGVDGNKIIVKGQTTVAQLKEGIVKDEETNVRVYSSLTSNTVMSDGDLVESGNIIVAADKNGTEMERSYNYYTIDKIKNEVNVETKVNGSIAKLYDEDDTLLVSASFNNYTNDDSFTAKMYAAQYRYGELVNVWETDSKTIAAGQTETFTCDFAGMTDRKNSSIKVLIVDEDFNPYIESESMRFNNKDTEATLYLLGDSIVQTYVDVGYPIQGWGYFIGDYLNDNITVENRATSGWTSDHYLYPDGIYTRTDGVTEYGTELTTTKGSKKTVGSSNRHKIWANILEELEPGDYVMFSLGINDSGSGNVPADRYLENIETIYNQATAKGATFILSTPTISGKDWDNLSFGESWGGRGVICTDFAKTHDAVCIPLGAELVKVYNAMADEYLAQNPTKVKKDANNYVRNYFHMYPENGTPPEGWDDFGSLTTNDSTHHNYIGSNKVASIIAKLIQESDSTLGDYVVIPE
ncbi:MAG: hypothetical protein IKJ68_11235 [Clostridia bacterium]|nr:hypothetical protein [Clostridia bacterium]